MKDFERLVGRTQGRQLMIRRRAELKMSVAHGHCAKSLQWMYCEHAP